MKYYSTKTYGNDRGLSCCFRQWKAKHSHCSLLHGYSLGVRFVFECDELDINDWVFDFGGMKEMKNWLEDMFDHTVLISHDDPELNAFKELAKIPGIIDLRIVPAVGCEKFAEQIFNQMENLIDIARKDSSLLNPTVRVKSVEVFEHDANSAIYSRES